MTMDTRDPNTNIPELKLKAKPTIEEWRAQKDKLDDGNDVTSILGCVGAPLAWWIEQSVPFNTLSDDAAKSLLEACEEARGNLLQMVNEQRDEAYDRACQEISNYAEYCDVSDCIDALNGSTTLDEVAEAGRDEVVSAISGFDSNGLAELTLEDIT